MFTKLQAAAHSHVEVEGSNASSQRTAGRTEHGFTLLELMVTMLIVSILALASLTTYHQYVVRTKVAKDFGLVSKAKTAVSAYYAVNQKFPLSNREAGMDDWSPANFTLYTGIYDDIEATLILVFDTTQIPELEGREMLAFHATEQNGRIVWDCSRDGSMPNQYRPAACRG